MLHAPRVVLLKLVEGFIVSVDSVSGYLVALLAACYWEVPALDRSRLEARLAACSGPFAGSQWAGDRWDGGVLMNA